MNSVLHVARHEFARIFSERPALAVLVVSVLIYAAFYPQPYVNEALRNVPMVVVDQDGTTSSRDFGRRVDASADVAVAFVHPDLPSAEREIYARNAFGILVIPKYFERDLLHGRPSPVALYADASYFLIYQRVSGSVIAVARTIGVEVEAARLIGVSVDPAVAVAAAEPMQLTAVPLFNPQGGYATYLLPAAFILILQQTLLIGVGLLGTLPKAGAPGADFGRATALDVVVGKLLAYLALEAMVVPFYLLVLSYLYDLPRLGSAAEILFLAVPFVLAVGALGLVIAALLRNPLVVQLTTAACGLPFFFLAGFAWPMEAMPPVIRALAQLLPSTSAIEGLVRVAQLGASLSEVAAQLWTLWVLALLYGALAVLLEVRNPDPRRAAPTQVEHAS